MTPRLFQRFMSATPLGDSVGSTKKITLEDCCNDPSLITDLSESDVKRLSEEADNTAGISSIAHALRSRLVEFIAADDPESSDGD